MLGYLYIISHPSFGKNIFKCGFTDKIKKDLESEYNTYYLNNVTVEKMYTVSNQALAEQMLFHNLKQYRVNPGEEFFKCDINILKEECIKVQKFVNYGYENDKLFKEFDKNIINDNKNIKKDETNILDKTKIEESESDKLKKITPII